jgi:AbrB family looped-hinge helix DNA binding protein
VSGRVAGCRFSVVGVIHRGAPTTDNPTDMRVQVLCLVAVSAASLQRLVKGNSQMTRTKVSSKYRILIPKEVRERANIKVGQQLQVLMKGGVIVLVPERPLSSLRGFAKGIRTTELRDKKDRV